ncbi:hypothetical protein [Silvibacterium dinghuense]|uniref:Uncharacterized protein n=1 Tax=Silvibacterium dinghuense TaxID=1560006 RepID=A0A4Q1SHF6_9BACT|nr:hypothetical protein [Silvibacterium dinghuense]RXS97008.1 hypothetical protein ESZ00_03490 [Silvibacterium dinghuense]GGG95448.1 hypothetical protein GCM10011586_08100 [Silvibacterium dinghuense]
MSTTFTVRNGTAVGQESLCRTCRHAHIQTGYADSEEEVRCGYFYDQPRLIPFAVNQCTDFLDKLSPTLYEMQKIAFLIDVKKTRAIAGFGEAAIKVTKPEEDDD